MLKENIRKMDVRTGTGMDIVIISCQNSEQELFWQERLKKTQGQILKEGALPIVIEEDWPGGAGNGLGTFYAYQKAREKGYVLYKIDIFQKQKEGYTIALYHTAGEGKQMYPLTAGEYGAKCRVKLPSLLQIEGKYEPMTILEAVIKQTNIYAPFRKGRLSVFWGDQIFIPSSPPDYISRHHADILVKMIPMPTEEDWNLKELSKYGLITINKEGQTQHIDKSDYATIKKLITTGRMSISGGVGISLGSFSLSSPLTFALLQEFQPELIQKNIKMDSDPYLWMPFTLDQDNYIQACLKKNISPDDARNHHLRLKYFKNHFLNKHPEVELFGIVDIGPGSFWWDFGNIENYTNNLLKMTQNSVEGYLLRKFFNIQQNSSNALIDSDIQNPEITSSVIVQSKADSAALDRCVVIGSTFKDINARDALFYNVFEEENKEFEDKTIRADCYLSSSSQHLKLYAEKNGDQKNQWSCLLPNNTMTYEEAQELIKTDDCKKSREEFTKIQSETRSTILS